MQLKKQELLMLKSHRATEPSYISYSSGEFSIQLFCVCMDLRVDRIKVEYIRDYDV